MSKGTSGMSGSEVTDRRFLFHCYGNPNSRNSSWARETMVDGASSRGCGGNRRVPLPRHLSADVLLTALR